MRPREPAPGKGLRPTRAIGGTPPAQRVGCWLVLLAVLLVAGACAQAVVIPRGPVLDREAATALLIAADVARADAYAGADPGGLHGFFSDSAVARVVPELARLRQQGQRIEERAVSRRLVHLAGAAGSDEGVPEVIGERRVGLATGPPRTWSRIVRRWWAAHGRTGGPWMILRFADLSPDQWWAA